ncbi:MAG: GDSL-type esterase/lipase family protein, partial [Oscillospiraceae bacterium]
LEICENHLKKSSLYGIIIMWFHIILLMLQERNELSFMNGQSNKSKRIKHSKIQQAFISICCLFLMAGSCCWAVYAGMYNDKSVKVQPDSSVTDAEVINNPPKDSSASSAESKTQDSNAESKQNSNTDSKAESKAESKADSQATANDDFSDAAFIGDSRTVGLEMTTNIPKASFYAATGLNVDTATSKESVKLESGKNGTVLDGMKEKQFNRIYIMFGINELGWPYPDVFQKEYTDLVNSIKEIQPNAKIYIQSILPVSSKAVSTNKVFTNENVENFNQLVKQVAADTSTAYLDVASVMKDENGSLPLDASTDGIHLLKEYCEKWLDYLTENSK